MRCTVTKDRWWVEDCHVVGMNVGKYSDQWQAVERGLSRCGGEVVGALERAIRQKGEALMLQA